MAFRDAGWSADLNPLHWLAATLRILGAAFGRTQGRDMMLYSGGVSFFAILAIFPALGLLVGAYGLLVDPSQAAGQAEAMANLMPAGVRGPFEEEVRRLVATPDSYLSAQSGVALLIGAYAAHRGFKALLAGLSFIHDEQEPRSFLGFQVLALLVLIAAFALMILFSSAFLAIQLTSAALKLKLLGGVYWLFSEWTWASFGLVLGFSLIYRFAMASSPVAWRASILGGLAASGLSILASWALAIYVERVGHFSAAYGSLGAAVVFLIWLSWNVNAVFYGGALATEVEIALKGPRPIKRGLSGRRR